MKLLKALLISLLSACATPHSGPTADIGSTFVAMSGGGVQELSPVADVAGLAGGAAISLGLRTAIIHNARGEANCPTVAGWTNAIGWGATCNNLAVAMGATPPVSLGLLAFCAITVKNKRAEETEAWCGEYELTDMPCTLSNLPAGAKAARCINGHLALK